MYSSPKKNNPTLRDAANEAVGRIYGAGLSMYRGKVVAGGNNVMANMAAAEFDTADLKVLNRGTAMERSFASIIAIRQHFAGSSSPDLLQDIYDEAQRLKKHGWAPCLGEPGPAPYRS
jgi:hypothetical protein